jgi:very-short-patch-repair endonuclease
MTDRLTPLAKNLRKGATHAERLVWKHLRAKHFKGFKLKRQQPIGKYIVDFVCFERKLIIELDGGQHTMLSEKQKDIARDKWFEAQGYKILRFWDNEVLLNARGVLEVIGIHCFDHPPLSPLPSREGKSEEVASIGGSGK